jgi:hypothetical protein
LGASFINTSFGSHNSEKLFSTPYHGWDDFCRLRLSAKTPKIIRAILKRTKNMPYSMLKEQIIRYC